ncbi:hypothetical protein EVAR_92963_1 [Eumeta japonica]|uniref:Uncharacterized protein n=1 Tax=Eumeta variegata TaxID=151549 RepID=A0A4C1TD11_EUMVA|nr:hypothetical protein EVAR_92963_1 [Eumeta japonica]
MKNLMDVSEAREICKDRTMWKSIVSAYPLWETGRYWRGPAGAVSISEAKVAEPEDIDCYTKKGLELPLRRAVGSNRRRDGVDGVKTRVVSVSEAARRRPWASYSGYSKQLARPSLSSSGSCARGRPIIVELAGLFRLPRHLGPPAVIEKLAHPEHQGARPARGRRRGGGGAGEGTYRRKGDVDAVWPSTEDGRRRTDAIDLRSRCARRKGGRRRPRAADAGQRAPVDGRVSAKPGGCKETQCVDVWSGRGSRLQQPAHAREKLHFLVQIKNNCLR